MIPSFIYGTGVGAKAFDARTEVVRIGRWSVLHKVHGNYLKNVEQEFFAFSIKHPPNEGLIVSPYRSLRGKWGGGGGVR